MELSEVDPVAWLTRTVGGAEKAIDILVVRFREPVVATVFGNELFVRDGRRDVHCGSAHRADCPTRYLAQQWPGVTFLAPDGAGGEVALVECRPPDDRGPRPLFAAARHTGQAFEAAGAKEVPRRPEADEPQYTDDRTPRPADGPHPPEGFEVDLGPGPGMVGGTGLSGAPEYSDMEAALDLDDLAPPPEPVHEE